MKKFKKELGSSFKNLFFQKPTGSNKIFLHLQDEVNQTPTSKHIQLSNNFRNYFDEICVLGEGASSIVKKVRKKTTGEYFVAKYVKTRNPEIIDNIQQEYSVLKKLNHECILSVKELFVDSGIGEVILITEFFENTMNLQTFIQRSNNLSSLQQKSIFRQILIGIQYLHSHGIVHRDLKPENILVITQGQNLKIKLIDFNVAKFYRKINSFNFLSKENFLMNDKTGTIQYRAPEMLLNYEYTEMVDQWSAGCILYFILCKKIAFSENNLDKLAQKIQESDYQFPSYVHDEQAKDLIRKLLVVNPQDRLQTYECLWHDWLQVLQQYSLRTLLTIEEIQTRERFLSSLAPNSISRRGTISQLI